MDIQPFKINIPELKLVDLRQRWSQIRWPDSIADGWEYGTDLRYLQELVQYWQTQFDWRKQEQWLNSFPQFIAEVDGNRIHFIHQRSTRNDRIPLIITHGWPGSFVEMLGLLPLLRDRFHVVVPSLPGFAFSGPTHKKGIFPGKIASLWIELMNGLGYAKFLTQGGDWGATVSTWLALDHREHIMGVHLNYIPGSYKPFHQEEDLSIAEQEFLQEKKRWDEEEGGYGHIQATRPQTVAFGLNDSPAGLAAWILEKIRDWSDCNGEIEKRFTKDEILTNIQIYWLTETIHSSMRIYYEAKKMPLQFHKGQQVDVPCAVARFPLEAPMPPRQWMERGYHLVRWTEMPSGGHFAAWEEPELLARDLIEFADSI